MIAQPALSTQLKNLENNLGVRLVERGAKKISLTPAGEIFYKKAQAICALDTSMHEELQNYMHGIEGTLKLSMTPSNPPSLLHFLFDSFVEAHPNVNFEFHEALSPVFQRLASPVLLSKMQMTFILFHFARKKSK